MSADPNVQLNSELKKVRIHAEIKNCAWLDSGKQVKAKHGEIAVEPFSYGTSYSVRVLRFRFKQERVSNG